MVGARIWVVKCPMDRVLVEVDRFDVMLIIVGMVELVVSLVAMVIGDSLVVVTEAVLLNLMSQSLTVVRIVHSVHVLAMSVVPMLMLFNWSMEVQLLLVASLAKVRLLTV